MAFVPTELQEVEVPSPAPPGTPDAGHPGDRRRWPWPETVGLLALAIGSLSAYLVWPLLPTYDLAHQLLWGDDILHGRTPELSSFRAPTEHPLALLFGVALAPLGELGQHVAVITQLVAFVALVAGSFAFANALFGRWVAWATALLVVSRLDYAALAIRSYLDVAYLAIVVWAAAFEAQRPRRGGVVWLLLIAAGLLRPECWMIAGLYAIWLVSGGPRWWVPQRSWVGPLALAACAPVLWSITDLILTGEPLFSLTYTSKSAGELLHRLTPAQAPEAAIHYVVESLKWPVAAACALGAALALWREPRRSWIPLVLIACGLGSFLILTVGGFAAIARYLAIASLVALVFGGYLLAGWTRLEPGRLRTAWLVAAAVATVVGGGFALTHTSARSIRNDLDVRERVPQRLAEVLDQPEVVAARRCGPVSLPNQKLISDVRLLLGGARASEVVARSDPGAGRRIFDGGVAITITSKRLGWHPAYVPTGQGKDSPLTQFPPTGFRQVIDNGWFAAYVRCA